jgi:bifunctional enzyme CysN/CysC
MANKSYWNHYYQVDSHLVAEPSNYAVLCASEWTEPLNVLEVGCGNGRDAFYFALLGHDVIGLDISERAVRLCQESYDRGGIVFVASTLRQYLDAEQTASVDVVYSRFSLHAMNKKEEEETLQAAAAILKSNGRLYIECRSINDPMAQLGDHISEDERIYGHYRRFIRIEKLMSALTKLGFDVARAAEMAGVTPLGDDDPVVIRLTAIKLG